MQSLDFIVLFKDSRYKHIFELFYRMQKKKKKTKKLSLKNPDSQKIRWSYSIPFFQVIFLENIFIGYVQIPTFNVRSALNSIATPDFW